MGTNNLTDRSNGQVITESFFNDIHQAMDGDFVGRNSSGAPTSGQNLGTSAIPWGVARVTSLVVNGSNVDTSQITAPQNRVVSGKTRSTSNKTDFITASGSGLSATIEASSTNLVIDISGTSYTVSSDIALSSLTAAPSSNNTALVNDASISSDKFAGEIDYGINSITIDTVGSEISALVGQWITLKTSTEYMFGYLESSTKLTNVFRGFFFDSSNNPIERVGITNNDTLTLMSTGWVFVDDDGATADVTYTTPSWSFSAPSSPATGDYWLDLNNNLWKRYSGSSFETIGRTFVGWVVMDTTNCVAARSVDAYFNPKDTNVNGWELEVSTTEIITTRNSNHRAYIFGNEYQYNFVKPTWNITTDLDTGVSETNSTTYYMYLKENSDTVISDQKPYKREDLNGKFHPYESWLYMGRFFNDGSGDIEYLVDNSSKKVIESFSAETHAGYGSTNTKIPYFSNERTNTIFELGTITNDSTSGVEFIASRRCRVSAQFGSNSTSGGTRGILGITLNATATTNLTSLSSSERLILNSSEATNGQPCIVAASVVVEAGDIIRPHTHAHVPGVLDRCNFNIVVEEL